MDITVLEGHMVMVWLTIICNNRAVLILNHFSHHLLPVTHQGGIEDHLHSKEVAMLVGLVVAKEVRVREAQEATVVKDQVDLAEPVVMEVMATIQMEILQIMVTVILIPTAIDLPIDPRVL